MKIKLVFMHMFPTLCRLLAIYGCCMQACQVTSVVSDFSLLCPWDFPGKDTGMGCHALFQEIFLTQGVTREQTHISYAYLLWQAGSLLLGPPRIYDIYKYLLYMLTPWCVSVLKALTELKSHYIFARTQSDFHFFLFVLLTLWCIWEGDDLRVSDSECRLHSRVAWCLGFTLMKGHLLVFYLVSPVYCRLCIWDQYHFRGIPW